MSTAEALADSVKAAISGGNATSSTVTTLQSLLSSAPGGETNSATTSQDGRIQRATVRTTKPAKSTRPPPKTSRKEQTFTVLEDEPRSLAPKARYALATEVINTTLKVLTNAVKQPPRRHARRPSGQTQSTPRRLSSTPSLSQRALQLRSGNETPVTQSPSKTPGPRRRPSEHSVSGKALANDDIVPTAECARLCFSYLRSVDMKKLGLREPPKLQLETGMLALCGKLIGLELHSLAAKELRAVKKRLESILPGRRSEKPASAPGQSRAESEPISGLMQLNIDLQTCREAWPLVVNLQMYALQVIAASHKPACTEEVLPLLRLESLVSPGSLILQQVAEGGDSARASKQLATLSRTILQLCPNVASSADEAAKDPSQSPSPLTVFKLQAISLQLRQESMRLLKHGIDEDKEVVEPFSKCLAALVRRIPAHKISNDVFEACKCAPKTLGIASGTTSEANGSKFVILRTLSILAERASSHEEALALAEQAFAECKTLKNDHARFLAALTRKLSAALSKADYAADELCTEMDTICDTLRKTLSGSAHDYEALFAELVDISTHKAAFKTEPFQTAHNRLMGSVAGFASSYVRLFPNMSVDAAQQVIQSALSQCGSNNSSLGWVTIDTAQVLVRSGVLRRVAGKLSSRPLILAWSSFSSAITLARILKVIVLKSTTFQSKNYVHSIVDDEKISANERGALLEWQLKCALEVTHKPKYHVALKTLLPEYFRRLATVYSSDTFPLRRARVANQAYCIREQAPELVAPHHLAALTSKLSTIDEDRLANDQGLAQYALSIKASLGLSVAFSSGLPTVEDLRPSVAELEVQLNKAGSFVSLDDHIDNPNLLSTQLTSLYDYFEVLGDDAGRLKVARLLSRYGPAGELGSSSRHAGVLRLARTYISLGFAEKAGEALLEIEETPAVDKAVSVEVLESLVCKAEYLLAMNDLIECQKVLELIQYKREDLQSRAPRSLQNSRYRLLLGRAWLLASQWMFESGSAHDSLATAKRAVKVMNSIWSGLERSGSTSDDHPASCDVGKEESAVEGLTKKVSKLVLKPETKTTPGNQSHRKGATFWPVFGLLCKAFMHLANVYMHHGIFNEANYSSEQAIKFAESIDSSHMLSRVRYYRSILLTAAGRLEDAELCLAHDPNEDNGVPPLTMIDFFRAKAALSIKNGELKAARGFLEQAEAVIKRMQSSSYLASLEQTPAAGTPEESEPAAKAEIPKELSANSSRKGMGTTRARQNGATAKVPAKTSKVAKKPARQTTTTKTSSASSPRMLERLEAMILIDKAIVSMRLGRPDDKSLESLKDLTASCSSSFKRRQLEHEVLMHKVYSELQADFSFNVLPESTLSFPALQGFDRRLSAVGSKGPLVSTVISHPPAKAAKSAKGAKRAHGPAQPLADIICAARRCIAPDCASYGPLSTTETHRQYSLMANASMMLSATSASHALDVLHPIHEALAVEYGRLHASQSYSIVADMERNVHASLDPLAWPEVSLSKSVGSITPRTFRDQYIDTLPKPWTAVSMTLNETCEELYITRYQRSQPPLIIRLPFSRQNSDEADEEIFDFHMGKEELKDIIEQSNYSCHNSFDTKAKGSKTNWWSEREALDRRLQELLINMENIWLGGFKGILSQHQREQDELNRFRRSFEAVMDRHLPSRKTVKKGSKKLMLDDQILELFIGLGSDQDGEVDLDEPLADLLYFVVDILQFNGERNAYDEIDFDSMAIDVLDALRTYHDSVSEQSRENAHLILVLDKRLQAFPWESLPCLERCSVSRVDSMLTLRDRLAQMCRKTNSDDGQFTVSRRSGSYILNPSSDLKSTETMLEPTLSKIAASNEAGWSSIVGSAPSEDDFRTCLTNSSIMLYFGHGAGSQYIGQRAIRRLDKCSEVVWLMGCSSGALTEYDELEPVAVPLAYLVAGGSSDTEEHTDSAIEQRDSTKCMAVVSTLWDVTDKDIDRFTLAVGEEWGLWKPEKESTKLPAKTPRKRERLAAPLTPEKTAKTPKTPKVKKTPAPARTPARSRSRASNDIDRKQSLVEAVAKSRDACYLRYLNGAAPVVYGVPVYLGD